MTNEEYMPTMTTVESAWEAMGEGRFVAWLAAHDAEVREQAIGPFIEMVDDMREAVAFDVLTHPNGEASYPVSYLADSLEKVIDSTLDGEFEAHEVTDAEVEAAARKVFEYDAPSHEPDEWSGLSEPLKFDYRGTARAALEAARKVK